MALTVPFTGDFSLHRVKIGTSLCSQGLRSQYGYWMHIHTISSMNIVVNIDTVDVLDWPYDEVCLAAII